MYSNLRCFFSRSFFLPPPFFFSVLGRSFPPFDDVRSLRPGGQGGIYLCTRTFAIFCTIHPTTSQVVHRRLHICTSYAAHLILHFVQRQLLLHTCRGSSKGAALVVYSRRRFLDEWRSSACGAAGRQRGWLCGTTVAAGIGAIW